MTGVLTDEELRHAFLDHGPTWIRAQAAAYGTRAGAVPAPIADGFRPFFGADIDRARVVAAKINNPPFYAELLARGVDRRDLLDFAAGVAGITFDTTIVIAPRATEGTEAQFTGSIASLNSTSTAGWQGVRGFSTTPPSATRTSCSSTLRSSCRIGTQKRRRRRSRLSKWCGRY